MNDELRKTVIGLIERRTSPVPFCGCWIWLGSTDQNGYGDFRAYGRHYTVHRAAYEAFVGPIPDGLHVLHSCDVPSCCNPAHLMTGTNSDNIADSVKKGRRKGVSRRRPTGLVYQKMNDAIRNARYAARDDIRKAVKDGIAKGLTHSVLARELNISIAQVSRLRNGLR